MKVDKYLSELYDKDLMNNYAIRPSPIHGKGAFAKGPHRKGDFINTHFKSGEAITKFGSHLNHSSSPNARSIKQKDGSYKTYAERDIGPEEEFTLDYTVNQDLEQPGEEWNVTEKVIVRDPPVGKEGEPPEIKVDASDEPSITFSPKTTPKNAKVNEGGADTVYGQGTNPKPEDETYLSLLKKSTKVKVDVKTEKVDDDEDRDEIEMYVPDNKVGATPSSDLNPSYYASSKKR